MSNNNCNRRAFLGVLGSVAIAGSSPITSGSVNDSFEIIQLRGDRDSPVTKREIADKRDELIKSKRENGDEIGSYFESRPKSKASIVAYNFAVDRFGVPHEFVGITPQETGQSKKHNGRNSNIEGDNIDAVSNTHDSADEWVDDFNNSGGAEIMSGDDFGIVSDKTLQFSDDDMGDAELRIWHESYDGDQDVNVIQTRLDQRRLWDTEHYDGVITHDWNNSAYDLEDWQPTSDGLEGSGEVSLGISDSGWSVEKSFSYEISGVEVVDDSEFVDQTAKAAVFVNQQTANIRAESASMAEGPGYTNPNRRIATVDIDGAFIVDQSCYITCMDIKEEYNLTEVLREGYQ